MDFVTTKAGFTPQSRGSKPVCLEAQIRLFPHGTFKSPLKESAMFKTILNLPCRLEELSVPQVENKCPKVFLLPTLL